MEVKSTVIFAIIIIAVIILGIKTVRDYKLLTGNDQENIYVNHKSFNWKSGVFIFLAVAMICYTQTKDIYTWIVFFCLLGVGCLNLVCAMKLRSFKKRKSED